METLQKIIDYSTIIRQDNQRVLIQDPSGDRYIINRFRFQLQGTPK